MSDTKYDPCDAPIYEGEWSTTHRCEVPRFLHGSMFDHPFIPRRAASPDVERWISVEDRLPPEPEYSQTYAVVTSNGQVMALDWTRNKYAATERGRAPRWEWHGRLSPWPVKLWQPLPDPPEGK